MSNAVAPARQLDGTLSWEENSTSLTITIPHIDAATHVFEALTQRRGIHVQTSPNGDLVVTRKVGFSREDVKLILYSLLVYSSIRLGPNPGITDPAVYTIINSLSPNLD